MQEKVSGIYKITCNINGKVYVGRSKDIYERWKQHLYKFENKMFSQRGLQKDLKLYGLNNFNFEVLEVCNDTETQKAVEIDYINLYQSYDPTKGYNRLSDKHIIDENERGKHWGSSYGINREG